MIRSRPEISPFTAFSGAALSSAIIYLSFQPRNLSWTLAFFAFVPLLAVTRKCRSLYSACGLGLFSGFAFYYIELYWITNSIAGFTSLPPIVVTLVMALLALYMGLYWAIFCGTWYYLNHLSARRQPSATRILTAFAGAAIWLLLEDLRTRFLGGFPWHPLGLTQIDNLYLNWLLPLGGVRLLSSLVIIANIGIYLSCSAICRKEFKRLALYGGLILLPLIGLAFFGSPLSQPPNLPPAAANSVPQIISEDNQGELKTIVIIQPNIPQKEKWRPENREKIIKKMLAMSRESLSRKPDLIVWPEAALPLLLEQQPTVLDQLRQFVAENRVSLMLGSPRLLGSADKPKKVLYNSIFLISPENRLQIYNKIKLVPYGEFTPLASLFPFISKIVPGLSYSPGNKPHNFTLKNLKIAPSVCFEGVFPAFSAGFFAAGADLLINLTNDAWFGDSPGPRQHLTNIRLRALENHCTIIRCANTGISAIIKPDGKIEQHLPLNQEGILAAAISFPRTRQATFFARHRHLPTYLAGLYLLLFLGKIIITRRIRRRVLNSIINS
ncbi:MAG: apolipoprotein N-acyltransferase [Deltaproteobacteria bacterium]|nr:apolipoprotein N-acyltransferase [Deltaproteobacteria bacterium]